MRLNDEIILARLRTPQIEITAGGPGSGRHPGSSVLLRNQPSVPSFASDTYRTALTNARASTAEANDTTRGVKSGALDHDDASEAHSNAEEAHRQAASLAPTPELKSYHTRAANAHAETSAWHDSKE